jgi:hypothetical protein
VPITEALLDQILGAAQHDPEDHPTFRTAWFREATFQGDAEFDNATFQSAWFDGATLFACGVCERRRRLTAHDRRRLVDELVVVR